MKARRQLLLIFAAAAFAATTISCSCQNEDKPGIKEYDKVIISRSMLSSLARKLGYVEWKGYIQTNEMPFHPEYTGYQVGALLANWTVAVLVKDQKMTDTITTNWFELSKNIDFDDDITLLRIKDRAQDFEEKMEEDSKRGYKEIVDDINFIKNEVSQYFDRNDKGYMAKQIAVSMWLEFLYISMKGLSENYKEEASTVFNRWHEAKYFLEWCSVQPELNDKAKELLAYLRTELKIERGGTLSQEKIISVLDKIKEFRQTYIY